MSAEGASGVAAAVATGRRDTVDDVPGGAATSSHRLDLLVLAGLVILAAILRLPGLNVRGTWDADQGHDLLVLWRLVYDHQIPLLGPPTSIGDFHHGALYYFLLAPFAWISGDDPVVVVGAIAVGGVCAVAVTWWLARSIGGSIAGLVAGLLMAVSSSAINESTFVWNPNLIALSASIALAGAWQAHRTGRARWWVVAAIGVVVTMECHVLGIALAPPIIARYLLDVRRASDPAIRRRLVRAGLAAIVILVIAYLPLAVHELTSNFSETRAAISFIVAGGQPVALSLPARLLFVGLRIVAWPLAGLLTDHLAIGVGLGVALIAGMAWRARVAAEPERGAVRFLAATLAFGWLVLGVGVGGLATVTPLPVDHYHAFLDPIVFVAAGLTVAGLWRLLERAALQAGPRRVAQGLVAVAIALLAAFNLAIAPPSIAADGGWSAADIAAQRILMATAGRPIELRSLPAFKAADAYGFPLIWFHADVIGTLDTPTPWSVAAAASASRTGAVAGEVPAAALGSTRAIVTVCDSLFIADCGGAAEAAAVPGTGFTLADRFQAAPGRTISIYLPAPG
ncbi:MAG TPA: glycosyltransferase family 39 protein [Candidatus Limnocylindrales bacterium]|nr:glycosyltransferase family 39 protein [Candidatus Limnocylindrales bacterium]